MKSAFASLILLAASVSAQGITLNTPTGATSAIQCENFQVSWTGGTPPFDLRLNDAGGNLVEDINSNVQSSPFTWLVNQPAGQQFSLALHDASGNNGLSGQFIIQTSSNTACLGASASGSSSATASAGASSASGASSNSAGATSAAASVSSSSGGSASTPAVGSSSRSSSPSQSSSGTAAAASRTNTSGAMANTASASLVGALFAALAAVF